MYISHIEPNPIWEYSYLRVAAGGKRIERTTLPLYAASGWDLPEDSHGLLITSDLQGCTDHAGQHLLGEELPAALLPVLEHLRVNPTKIGAILAGDMYANLHKRGGLGEVLPVWEAFEDEFAWVTGVFGNHDHTEYPDDFLPRKDSGILKIKDARPITFGDFLVTGVNGVIGNKRKPNRLEKWDFLDKLEKALELMPQLLILHQGPDMEGERGRQCPEIKEVLEAGPKTTVICGHTHWERPLKMLKNGTQVLNVDGSAFLLR